MKAKERTQWDRGDNQQEMGREYGAGDEREKINYI